MAMPAYADLISRVHFESGALARSPGHVRQRYPTPAAAMKATLHYLQPLPEALIARWLAEDRGHIIIQASQHGFELGKSRFRRRWLEDVAWVRITLLVDDPIDYLMPVAALLASLIGWGSTPDQATQPWQDFVRGVRSSFDAGYGRRDEARADVDAYLAEGIAWYLVDRRGLNITNPRLEKLLRATVFNEAWCRRLF